MSSTIKRTDYFGQVFACETFQSLQAFSAGQKKNTEPSSVLLVTKKNGRNRNTDSVKHFVSILSQKNINLRVLFCDEKLTSEEAKLNFIEESDSLKVFTLGSSTSVLNSPISDIAKCSFAVNKWFEANLLPYEVVISLDCLDELFFPLEARAAGIAYANNTFLLSTKNCSLLEFNRSARPLLKPADLNLIYMQRKVFEYVDLLVSDSRFFLNWLLENGFELDSSKLVESQLPVDIEIFNALKKSTENQPKSETIKVVFVFNENTINDCLVFLDALKRLKGIDLAISIVFQGKKPSKHIRKAIIEADSKLEGITVKLVKTGNGVTEISQGQLIVVPCFEEFDSYQYYFLTTQNKLLSDQHAVIETKQWKAFNHQPEKVVTYLKDFFADYKQKKPIDISFSDSNQAWFDVVTSLESEHAKLTVENVQPLVSVCIAHYNRGEMLLGAIESINKQSYQNIEIIIVDDGSTGELSQQRLEELDRQNHSHLPITVIRQKNSYLGASRNAGIAAANGEYILFMDDDNEAMPGEIATFVKAALISDADIYTCFSDVFQGDGSPSELNETLPTALFLGASLSTAAFTNPFGDSNMFVRRETAAKLNGFSEFYKVGRDDQEFLYRASLSGYRVQLIPKALYWYRLSKTRMRQAQFNQYAGIARVSHTIMQTKSMDQSLALRYLQGQSFVCGPWGVTDRNFAFKSALTELARGLLLRYPKLYRVLRSIRERL